MKHKGHIGVSMGVVQRKPLDKQAKNCRNCAHFRNRACNILSNKIGRVYYLSKNSYSNAKSCVDYKNRNGVSSESSRVQKPTKPKRTTSKKRVKYRYLCMSHNLHEVFLKLKPTNQLFCKVCKEKYDLDVKLMFSPKLNEYKSKNVRS